MPEQPTFFDDLEHPRGEGPSGDAPATDAHQPSPDAGSLGPDRLGVGHGDRHGAYEIMMDAGEADGLSEGEALVGTAERPFGFGPEDTGELADEEALAEEDFEGEPSGPQRDPETGRYTSRAEGERLEALRQAEPLLRAIEGDPGLQQMILEHLAGREAGHEASYGSGAERSRARVAQTGGDSAEMPSAPERPAAFDPVEAMTDPESDSARYVRERDAYFEERIAWQERELERQHEEALRAVEREQAALRERAIENELSQRYEMSREDVEDFRRVMSDPKSMSLPNLVEFWRFQRRRSQQGDPELEQRARQMRRRQQRLKQPSPPTGGGATTGEREGALSFEARMNAALFSDPF